MDRSRIIHKRERAEKEAENGQGETPVYVGIAFIVAVLFFALLTIASQLEGVRKAQRETTGVLIRIEEQLKELGQKARKK